MVRLIRPSGGVAAFASGMLLLSSQALGQAAAPVDTISSVDVVAPKKKTGIEAILPGTDKPKSTTCEYIASVDPTFRAQMAVMMELNEVLFGPTVHLPTRAPKNPDYNAPPVTPPGSALPALPPRVHGPVGTELGFSLGPGADVDPLGDAGPSMLQAVNACRVAFVRGGGPAADMGGTPSKERHARAEIARFDKTMPLGFALFDEGRYEEALVQFKAGYKKLSEAHGGDEAALMIGKIYLLGLGAKSDPKEGVSWLKKAAMAPFNPTRETPAFDPMQPDLNTPMGEAAVMLGNIYFRGLQGFEKDTAEARKWFTRAAAVGHVPAWKILGDLYYSGFETPRDVKRAMQYYKQAATLNLDAAQVALANIYYNGDTDVSADLAAALDWYSQAAKQEHPDALYALAVAYDLGEGVSADPDKALGFYKASALKGHAQAQAALGSYFYEGTTVAKDLPTARQWFEAAAKGGDADAMFNLGVMMMKGEGGAKDQTRAWVWLRIAEKGGVEQAPAARAALERRMTPDEKRTASALYSPSGQS